MVQWKKGKWDVSNIRFLSFRGLIFHETMMGVSLNGGTPKSSILTGFSFTNHPFWGTTILGNPQIVGRKPGKWTQTFSPQNLHRRFSRGDDGVLPRLATGATRVTYPKSLGQPGRGFLDSVKKAGDLSSTWMSRWKLGSMVHKWVIWLQYTGVYKQVITQFTNHWS